MASYKDNAALGVDKAIFLEQYPCYGYGGWLDDNFQQELGKRFDGQHYLDWTGAGQYTNSQLAAVMQELMLHGFGNPHSRNASSARSTLEVAAARSLVLQHFNADPAEYDIVFTKGASESLKIVGECFPWSSSSTFTYTLSNHKSVAHAKSDGENEYLVLLDVAAYVPTHGLDLSTAKPDFVPLSFYKMFGYPSGLGALLVRKSAAGVLRKVYFGGGSVDYCTAQDAWHVLSAMPAGYEDGTLGFLNILSLKHGFRVLQQLGGMQAIAAHVESLRSWTYQRLMQLKHSNGAPMVLLFGEHDKGPEHQSCIFQFQ
eukprot:gene6756-6973_t